ncbi:DNA adenine methylase [Rhodobacter ferrooxidans]|uniref:site-specific DNA-methyltransferase (adenine-specific) n=1 Tax=Rhodobacter ferrooxidans TaxID=371731 RepID=C8RXK3_9RHOB|nr:DNA adenine methylase [Rhodobacter sp. SW2]EEW26728.1 D12 class N6 adenine-specific DNA methyltransferase [Rhodobacter sp. SW2]
MKTELTSVAPVRPIAPWLGGKRNLAKRICAIIDADDRHRTYAEPFVGMGGIFLRRSMRPQAEFINDAGRDIYNLFRVLQEHYVPFLDMLRFQITTQANFNRLVGVDPDTLTDMQRAARFLYLQRCAFGGKVSGRNFGLAVDRPARFNLTTLQSDLEALHTRLSGVTVTCLDFAEFIRRVDRPEVLFYLDPPYWGCEADYGKALFSRERFEGLAAVLGALKGRFILSLNDVKGVRETFAGFEFREVKTTYTIGAGGASPDRAEVLISNWPLGLDGPS